MSGADQQEIHLVPQSSRDQKVRLRRFGGNWLYNHEFGLMFRMLSLEVFWIPNDNRVNGLWHPNRCCHSRAQPERDDLLIKAGAR
jgi:hypothetical protein